MKKLGIFILLLTGILSIIGSFVLVFRSLLFWDIVWGGFFPCCPYCAPGVWAIWNMLRDTNMNAELFVRLHLFGAILTFVAGIVGIVFGFILGRKQSGRFANKEK